MGLPPLPADAQALIIMVELTGLAFSKLSISWLEVFEVDSPTYAEIKKGLMDLESLIPQIESAEMREEIKNYIDLFNNRMKKESIQ